MEIYYNTFCFSPSAIEFFTLSHDFKVFVRKINKGVFLNREFPEELRLAYFHSLTLNNTCDIS